MKFKQLLLLVLTLLYYPLFGSDRFLIVSTEDYPPYSFKNKFGVPTGIDIDIVKEAAKRAGLKVDIRLYPWTRALKMAETGTADGIAGCFHSKEREEFLYYTSTQLRDLEVVFFSNTSVTRKPKTVSDLSNLTVGTVQSYFISDEFSKADNFNKVEISTPRLLFNILIGKGINAAAYSKKSGLFELQKFPKEKRDEIKITPYIGKPLTSSYLVFSRKSALGQKGKQAFNLILGEMKTDGTISRILMRYQ